MAESLPEEKLLGEEVLADITVRYVEAAGHCYAIGSPVADEWCYLADSASAEELKTAARLVLDDVAARDVFVRMSALLGVAWNEGQMVPLLAVQEREAMRLYEQAPDTAEADPEELRRIRREAAEETTRDN